MNKIISTFKIAILLSISAFFSPLNAQWQKTNGISGNKVNSITMKGATFYAGTDTGGVYKSTDNGLNWVTSNSGLDNKNVKSLVVHNNRMVAGISNGFGGAIFLSDDNANSWRVPKANYYGYLFCLAPNGADLLAGTWYGVAKSTDTGFTWSSLSTSGMPSNAGVSSIVTNSTGIYAGVSSSSVGGTGVFFSTNGNSWAGKNSGLTNTTILSMGLLGANLFAGTQGGGLFKSINNGSNWTAVNTGLTDLYVNTITTYGRNVFIGTNSGIFKSADSGTNWTNIGDTLFNNTPVYAIAFQGNFILAGTDKDLLRRPSTQVTNLNQIKAERPFVQIYPNPGTGILNLETLNPLKEMEITIMNMQGQITYYEKVKDEKQLYTLDLSNYPKGIYLVSILHNEGQINQRIIIQ